MIIQVASFKLTAAACSAGADPPSLSSRLDGIAVLSALIVAVVLALIGLSTLKLR